MDGEALYKRRKRERVGRGRWRKEEEGERERTEWRGRGVEYGWVGELRTVRHAVSHEQATMRG